MKNLSIILFSLIISQLSFSQNVLLTIGDNEITQEEFERIYLKNNNQAVSTDDEIDDYLELFVNFKLKVIEAEALGYDTTSTFKTEFNQYFSQLAEPYFIDTAYQTQLLKQAYQRSKKEVRVRYIIIKSPPDQDTLVAYQKAMDAYNRIKSGEDFFKVAFEVSESTTAKRDSADGWYNQVFMMPYNLENFTYEAKIGDISQPLFANNAYFILKVEAYREVPKKVRASHIYISLPKNSTEADSLAALKKIDSIKIAFKNGRSFKDVAMDLSQDTYSSSNGGDLGWFGTGRMLREFEAATFNIKNVGDSVGPIRSAVGFHFIKLTGVEKIGSFADEKEELTDNLVNNDRYKLVKENVIKKLKKEYNFQITEDLDDFYNNVDSTIFNGTWTNDYFKNNNTVLFKFADQEFTKSDFAKYLYKNQRYVNENNINLYIDKKFKTYVDEKIKDYEITQLPNKSDDFKYLIKEYHDGLLLFDVTNDMVWNKAVKDTVGLRTFFNQNKNNYTQKINIAVYSFPSEKVYLKIAKKVKKKSDKNADLNTLIEIITKSGVEDISGVFTEGDNDAADLVISKMKNNSISNNQFVVFDENNNKIIVIKDNLRYVKGLVTADYQNILEEEWIKSLRDKYEVKINQSVLNSVKANN